MRHTLGQRRHLLAMPKIATVECGHARPFQRADTLKDGCLKASATASARRPSVHKQPLVHGLPPTRWLRPVRLCEMSANALCVFPWHPIEHHFTVMAWRRRPHRRWRWPWWRRRPCRRWRWPWWRRRPRRRWRWPWYHRRGHHVGDFRRVRESLRGRVGVHARALRGDMHWQSLVRWQRVWHVLEQLLYGEVPIGWP